MKTVCTVCNKEIDINPEIDLPICHSSGCYEQYALSLEEEQHEVEQQAIKDNTFNPQDM